MKLYFPFTRGSRNKMSGFFAHCLITVSWRLQLETNEEAQSAVKFTMVLLIPTSIHPFHFSTSLQGPRPRTAICVCNFRPFIWARFISLCSGHTSDIEAIIHSLIFSFSFLQNFCLLGLARPATMVRSAKCWRVDKNTAAKKKSSKEQKTWKETGKVAHILLCVKSVQWMIEWRKQVLYRYGEPQRCRRGQYHGCIHGRAISSMGKNRIFSQLFRYDSRSEAAVLSR